MYTNTMPAMPTHATTRCNCYVLLCQEPRTGWLAGEAMQPTCHSDVFLLYVAVQAVTVNKFDARCTRHPNPSEGTPVGGLMAAPFTSSHTPWRSAQMHVCVRVRVTCGEKVERLLCRSSRQVLCLYIVCEHPHVRIDRLWYTNDSNVANHSNLVIPLCLLLQHNRIIAATTTPQQLRTTTTNGHNFFVSRHGACTVHTRSFTCVGGIGDCWSDSMASTMHRGASKNNSSSSSTTTLPLLARKWSMVARLDCDKLNKPSNL